VTRARTALSVLVVIFAAIVGWLWLGTTKTDAPTRPTTVTVGAQSVDPESGLHWIALGDLPSQARHTLDLIRSRGPFPYRRDGAVFGNRERILPGERRGYYHEYTVATLGASNRGGRRIITGARGELYYTDDHYSSFRRLSK
jgi:ribonuclease T1